MNKSEAEFINGMNISEQAKKSLSELPNHQLRRLMEFQKGINQYEKDFKAQIRHDKIWDGINDILSVVTFFVVLPFTPIIWIILTIKGE